MRRVAAYAMPLGENITGILKERICSSVAIYALIFSRI